MKPVGGVSLDLTTFEKLSNLVQIWVAYMELSAFFRLGFSFRG